MFECMEIEESIYEGVVEKIYKKNILGHIPTVMVSAGKQEDNPPNQLLNPR